MNDRSPPAASPTITLIAVAGQVEQALEAALGGLGLNRRRLSVLGHVARTPGISFTELARRAHVTVQSMHAIVGALERDALLEAGAGQRGRSATITLTAEGERRLQDARRVVHEVDAAQFGAVEHPERERLAQALGELARGLGFDG